jgi:hypothetical protein
MLRVRSRGTLVIFNLLVRPAMENDMNNRTKRNLLLTALAVIISGGISQKEVRSREAMGNLAAPAATATCPALPDGVPLMKGLTTGWAMSSASTPLRILLSDQALACKPPRPGGPPPMGACTESWLLSFTLPEELQAPGVYNLADHKVEFMQAVTLGGQDEGCGAQPCTGSSTGSAGGGTGPDSAIEIYAVTDACVTGRILRFTDDHSDADYTGAFQAVRCDAPANE